MECEIPLLLSKPSLKAAKSKLDFVNDQITMFDVKIDLQHTSNDHYCIPLTPKQVVVSHQPETKKKMTSVTLSISNLSSKSPKEKKDVALKLHKQFGHPEALKLKKLVNEAELRDPELLQKIYEVSDNCDTCRRYNRARSRPIVSLSL